MFQQPLIGAGAIEQVSPGKGDTGGRGVCVSGGVASVNASMYKQLRRALLSAHSVSRFLTIQVCQAGFSLCLTTIAN